MKISQYPALRIFIGCFLILIPMWYNGSPFYYPDSMGYIFWGLQAKAIPERAATYGLFVKYFSLGQSLWFNIYFQALVTMYFVWLLWFKILEIKNLGYFFFSCFVLGLGSSLGWTTGTLMPDIFCALSSLSLFILLFFHKKLSTITKLGMISLFLFFSVQHVSIFLINLLILSAFLVYFILSGQLKRHATVLIGLYILTVTSYFSIGLIHKKITGEFFISKSSSTFLMARFAETGILGRFLDENCGSKTNPLCAFRSDFPMASEYFLWNEKSPIHSTGGIQDKDKVYEKIVSQVLVSPKYLYMFADAGLRSTFKQFFLLNLGDGLMSGTKLPQLKFFPGNEGDFLTSKQYAGIDFENVSRFNYLVLIILIYFFIKNRAYFQINESLKITAIFIVILLVANSLVNGALSTPLNRYQVRVFWLVYLWLLAALSPALHPYFNSDSKSNS